MLFYSIYVACWIVAAYVVITGVLALRLPPVPIQMLVTVSSDGIRTLVHGGAEPAEVWTINGPTATISGRKAVTLEKKLAPVWWVMNDTQDRVDTADWYMPGKPYALRWLMWNVFRNPIQNFSCFVIGVQDKNYSVTVTEGRQDPTVIQRNDVGETGYQRYTFSNGRKFTSYSGVRKNFLGLFSYQLVYYYGTQPNGFTRAKLNLNLGRRV